MGTKSSEPKPKRRGTRSVGFWITLIRGLFALFLSLSLFAQPHRTRATLATFMGILLADERHHQHPLGRSPASGPGRCP